ncbi:hypothetical protein FH972_017674 [Carpinus fangiana]|uniref:Uncharacterized protein n=1 Tax=Carpinus fangiana TaxID=176857 RepID=A0A5N6RMM3_9ROSI|nr:hypothetical protein FH972_017674 [Carpinus fangiana]
MASTVRKLIVEVVEARNLVPKDGHGTSSWTSMGSGRRQEQQNAISTRHGARCWNSTLGICRRCSATCLRSTFSTTRAMSRRGGTTFWVILGSGFITWTRWSRHHLCRLCRSLSLLRRQMKLEASRASATCKRRQEPPVDQAQAEAAAIAEPETGRPAVENAATEAEKPTGEPQSEPPPPTEESKDQVDPPPAIDPVKPGPDLL